MKTKHFFTTFLLFIALNSFAQLDKKTWLMGGNASFDSYKRNYHYYVGDLSNPSIQEETYRYNNFVINAKMGYFIIDKLAVGISPSYSHLGTKDINSALTTFHSSTLSIGPFARYYFFKKNKPFNVFADASYQVGYTKYKGQNTSLKASTAKFSGMLGVELFFNDVAGVEFLAGYNYQKQNGDRNPFGVISPMDDKGFKIAIGFQLHLFKEK